MRFRGSRGGGPPAEAGGPSGLGRRPHASAGTQVTAGSGPGPARRPAVPAAGPAPFPCQPASAPVPAARQSRSTLSTAAATRRLAW
ncbi:hypothetical protein SUDANB6_04522 [Streptomyces sp. enrichment culture]